MSQPTNQTTDTGPRTPTLAEGERHRLLAAERRRLAVDLLAKRDSAIELEDLAAGIAAREEGLDVDEETVRRVATALHHVHLPRMAESDVLDYDYEARRIDPAGERIDAVRDGCSDI